MTRRERARDERKLEKGSGWGLARGITKPLFDGGLNVPRRLLRPPVSPRRDRAHAEETISRCEIDPPTALGILGRQRGDGNFNLMKTSAQTDSLHLCWASVA